MAQAMGKMRKRSTSPGGAEEQFLRPYGASKTDEDRSGAVFPRLAPWAKILRPYGAANAADSVQNLKGRDLTAPHVSRRIPCGIMIEVESRGERMKAQVLRGSKHEIARSVAGLAGEIREAIVFVEESSDAASPVEDIFAEMEAFTVQRGTTDYARDSIYRRRDGE
jgi:hypothetical protein